MLKTVTSAVAAQIDVELLASGFSLDQLMELAGLSVAQAVYKVFPPSTHPRLVVLAGPGNNGGDGLVCARHALMLGYTPLIYYPKPSKQELFVRLEHQLRNMNVSFALSQQEAVSALNQGSCVIVDALFGFSFRPPVRDPFVSLLDHVARARAPVVSVDIPSSWSVDSGPCGSLLSPAVLVSLTAPKPAALHFRGRHFVGGRFVCRELAARFGFDVPEYPGLDHVAEVSRDF